VWQLCVRFVAEGGQARHRVVTTWGLVRNMEICSRGKRCFIAYGQTPWAANRHCGGLLLHDPSPTEHSLDKSALLPLVYLLMSLHIIQPCKSPTTLRALMRPLPSMAQLVIALVEFARERLVAQGARMNGLLSLFRYRCVKFVGQVARLWMEGAGMPGRCKCACWEG
jgi:hypothetical protein